MSSHYDYHDSDYHNHTMIIMIVTVIVCNSTLGRISAQDRDSWEACATLDVDIK